MVDNNYIGLEMKEMVNNNYIGLDVRTLWRSERDGR